MGSVVRAKVLGFCMGVRRAVDTALREASAPDSPGPVFTMGPLIHNPRVMEGLKKAGVGILDEKALLPTLEGAAVIIRAHGVSPALEEELVRRGARVVDATCPRVKANQLKVRSLGAAGYAIFLAGEKDHGEIIGLRGYAEAAALPAALPGVFCAVAANPAGAGAAAAELAGKNPGAKTALVGQTTISPEEYAGIAGEIRRFFPGLEIIDSICGATRCRQEALRELCRRVDAVIVAGGRESANTRRLLAVAEAAGKKAWLVESAAALPREAAAVRVIGLSAGASTPDETVDEIERALAET